ncbi:MAG: hypothetical protein LBL69_03760 [Zoogloeaceae bacterium]|jgi:hypothetical protein|nr:hypothetical protein [Zoogloeaceae bacterium]
MMPIDYLQTLASLAFPILGAIWAVVEIAFSQYEKRQVERNVEQDKRLVNIGETLKKEADEWKRLERELMTLKADLPLQYVRREDYVRGQSVIEAKLDALYSELKLVQIGGLQPGG